MSVHGLCDRDEPHERHQAFPPDTTFTDHYCPGQYADCRNCDDTKCMGCIFREWDHTCADDCPMCCGTDDETPPDPTR